MKKNKIIEYILMVLPITFIGLIVITAFPILKDYSIIITGIMVVMAMSSTIIWGLFHYK